MAADLDDVVNQIAALRIALTQVPPQQAAPAWPTPAPQMIPPQQQPNVNFDPAAMQALMKLLQPESSSQQATPIDPLRELKEQMTTLTSQVQQLATSTQMIAAQMSALAAMNRTRKADEVPKEILDPFATPPTV